LKELHRRPAHPWTLEELARDSNTSRSVLAERFQLLVGSSPMQYLTRWRMLLPANLLSEATRRWRGSPRTSASRRTRRSAAPFAPSTVHRQGVDGRGPDRT
jgi:AraC-like DNA-binding protein